MSRINGSALVFDEEELESTTRKLPRLIRVIFFGLRITNAEFADRYYDYFTRELPNKTRKEYTQKSSADRKFIGDRHSLTFKLLEYVLYAMGLEIMAVSVRLRDRRTGVEQTFSTDQTVEELKALSEKEREIGIQSIF